MELAQAAVVMNDALNVFSREGLSAARAVDILGAAADAPSVDVEQVALAFSMSASVWGDANQRLRDLAIATAVLGKNGLKGSDAGTSLKTMLLKLRAPVAGAASEMKRLGLNVRDAQGDLLRGRDLIAELGRVFSKLDPVARDAALSKIFGTDAIRAASILLKEGVAGWDAFAAGVDKALPVAEKFDVLMSGIQGNVQKVAAALQRVGIAIGAALGPALAVMGKLFSAGLSALEAFIKKNQEVVLVVGLTALGLTALGAVLLGLGLALKLAAIAFTAFGVLAAVVSTALTVVTGVVTTLIGVFTAILTPLGLLQAVLLAIASRP